LKKRTRKRQPPDGPRKTAWRILLDWETGGVSLESLRERAFVRTSFSQNERALVTELTQGVVRHRLFLEYNISGRLDRPDASLPEPVRQVLFLGVYQLLLLDRIPPHAAVDESVRMIKESPYTGFSSLVNAILRKTASAGALPLPGYDKDPTHHTEIATSTPEWLVTRLAAQEGNRRALRILHALNRTPPLTLRVNTLKTTRLKLLGELESSGITASPGRLSDTAVVVGGRASPTRLPSFIAGRCTVQDEGAQMISPILSPVAGQRILDGCAAPGGKTGHLAQIMKDSGHIIAADRNLSRVRMMTEGITRLGLKSVVSIAAELSTGRSPFSPESFHGILLDAPCSGTGVLKRHPEGKWNKDPSVVRDLAAEQEALLRSMVDLLLPGGRLLYCTCSLLQEENEDVIDRFLSSTHGIVRLDIRKVHSHPRGDLFTKRGDLRLWPDLHDTDGFFACLMEKKHDQAIR
jgi:16S rRNA (cytosine967-C5)-methyltransferase